MIVAWRQAHAYRQLSATACRIGGQGAKGWIESNTPFEKYCSMPGRGPN
jgi:hypothetical protein